MTSSSLRAAWVLTALLAAAPATAESSIDCSGGTVRVGDAKLDLVAKCGRPALEERSAQGQAVVEVLDGEPSQTPTVGAERWTYNFGPTRFIQVVTLDAGRVVRIERGGYGYSPDRLADDGTGRARCESSAIRVGDRKLELLARCGRPAAREARQEQRVAGASPGARPSPPPPGFATVDVETWTYDFGPLHFRSIVTLENGRIVRVERGAYGTAR